MTQQTPEIRLFLQRLRLLEEELEAALKTARRLQLEVASIYWPAPPTYTPPPSRPWPPPGPWAKWTDDTKEEE